MKLVYLADPTFGGWVTMTAHLAHVLGQKTIFKVSKKIEKGTRDFGYGIFYQNIPAEAISVMGDVCVTAIDKKHYDCLKHLKNCWLVIHDPTEFSAELFSAIKDNNIKVITIRKTVHELLKNAGIENICLPHPFFRYDVKETEKKGGISFSRIDFDKHTDIILDANKLLESPIEIYGAVNPMYVFHKLDRQAFKECYKGKFKKDFNGISNLLSGKKFAVDMSAIKKDGGGTQYTFLEAILNGCTLILNEKWFENGTGELVPNMNCISVKNGQELASVISSNNDYSQINKNALFLLDAHSGHEWHDLKKFSPTSM